MAYPTNRLATQYSHGENLLDGKPASYLEGGEAVNPTALDSSIMQSPHDVAFGKDPFANSNGVLSPAHSHGWDPQYASHLSAAPASAGAPNGFHEDANLYPPPGLPHHPTFPQQQHPQNWNFDNGSGDCTPTTGGDFMPPSNHFDGSHHFGPQRTDSVHGTFSQPPSGPHFQPIHPEAGFIPAPQVQTPMSPHTHQEWMSMAQQETEGRRSQKRMRPMSPQDPLSDYRPRDGIRKKNNRIEIPPDRNITTIDEMISSATNEDLIKELKSQKRLLRNREAALASRQRKKKHTEDLEHKEKNYTSTIAQLESQINTLALERDRWQHESHRLRTCLDQSQRLVEIKECEKQDVKTSLEQDNSSLRLKVHYLTEQLEAPAMSAVPSSTGFTDCNVRMEALSMDPHEWLYLDDMGHDTQHDTPNSFSFEPDAETVKQSPVIEKKATSAQAGPAPAKQSQDAPIDQPAFSGLLFMLLLCGAFVASKPPSAQPLDLPKMPDTVRAEAPSVLKSLLSEPNMELHQHNVRTAPNDNPNVTPSGLPSSASKGNRLDKLHRTITSPTRQQEIDQAFSLTPSQYASLTNTDVPVYHPQRIPNQDESGSQPRRSLRQALASLEEEYDRNANKAEVHTRSRLMEQVTEDVVKQFKEMVRDHAELDARPATSHDYDDDFKTDP